MTFARPQLKPLGEALNRLLPVFHVLVGPRQVGKTTLAKQIQKTWPGPSVYASADAPLPPGPEWLETQWQLALHKAVPGKPLLLILDEVQKVRGWSETLKAIWDNRARGSDIRLLVLGSSALLMHHGLADSLTGRFFLHRCSHWAFTECRDAFGWSLPEWLFFGGYPGAAVFRAQEQQWKQYVRDSLVEPTLARDILQLQRVAKPALLRHLFMLSTAYPAQILSYTKMLGQLQDAGNTTTLAHYLVLLEAAFLVSGLEVHSGSHVRQRASSPKLVLWNNALVGALGTVNFEVARADGNWWGRLVENAVGAHLLNNLPRTEYNLGYWRDGDREIDYVVGHGANLWGLEVKSGRAGRTSGVAAFRRRYPEAQVLLIGGQGVPLEEFFISSPESWFH